MKPIINRILQEVITLPEYEPIPKDDDEAIRYLAQWDCGEYSADDTTLADICGLNGTVVVTDEYVLFRSYCGDATLYHIGAVCHPYELRQIDAWRDEDGGWTWNDSYHLRDVQIGEGDEVNTLLVLFSLSPSRHIVEDDGNGLYELQNADDHCPMFALIPVNK